MIKYENLIKVIECVFEGLTPEEQIELIQASPILHAIYCMGADDYKLSIERN